MQKAWKILTIDSSGDHGFCPGFLDVLFMIFDLWYMIFDWHSKNVSLCTLLSLLLVMVPIWTVLPAWKAFGSILSASYPIEKNLKRKKPHPEEEQIQWYPLELRNFPHWTVCDDIKTIILSLGPGPKRVRVIHYDPEPSLSIARAYFQEEEERDAIQKALAGYEISPGYVLKLSALPRTMLASRMFRKVKDLLLA